jgi:hypothetical protein
MGMSSGALRRYRIIKAVLNEKRALTASRVTPSPGRNPMLAIQSAATPLLLRTYHSKSTQTTPSVARLATTEQRLSREDGLFIDVSTNANNNLYSTGK